jgi:hypothetical protein
VHLSRSLARTKYFPPSKVTCSQVVNATTG